MTVAVTEQIEASELYVSLIGKEETVSVKNKGMRRVESRGEKVVLDEERLIHEFDKKPLEPGTYNSRFSIYLPGYLPQSMHYEGAKGGCSVTYILTVELGTEKIASVITMVGKSVSTKQYPCLVTPTTIPIKGVMRDAGALVVGAKLENKHVAKGGKFRLSLAARNKSREAIERVDVQLVEEIEWSTKEYQSRELVKLDTWMEVDLQGLDNEGESTASVISSKHDEMLLGSIRNELMTELATGHSVLQHGIPLRAFDSYQGTLMSVSHYLKINFITRTRRNRYPCLKVPLEVFDPPMETVIQLIPSKDKLEEVVTTVWPQDDKVLVRPHHHHSDTDVSYSSINENEPVIGD